MDTKAWYRSKTCWLNIASFLVIALALPEVGSLVPDAAVRYIGAIVAILNLWLRLGGAAPLSLKGEPTLTERR